MLANPGQQSAHIQSFDVRLGRPNAKLALQYNHISRKWKVHEPYLDALHKMGVDSQPNTDREDNKNEGKQG